MKHIFNPDSLNVYHKHYFCSSVYFSYWVNVDPMYGGWKTSTCDVMSFSCPPVPRVF